MAWRSATAAATAASNSNSIGSQQKQQQQQPTTVASNRSFLFLFFRVFLCFPCPLAVLMVDLLEKSLQNSLIHMHSRTQEPALRLLPAAIRSVPNRSPSEKLVSIGGQDRRRRPGRARGIWLRQSSAVPQNAHCTNRGVSPRPCPQTHRVTGSLHSRPNNIPDRGGRAMWRFQRAANSLRRLRLPVCQT